MKANQRPWVRRVLFIDRRYRAALFNYAMILSVATGLLSFGAQWAFTHWLDKNEAAQKLITPKMMPQVSAGLTFVVVFFTLIAFGLIISNRLVGPFFRMRRHMDAVTEGRQSSTEFRFRQEDFFLEVGESYNRLLQVLQGHRQRMIQQERENLVVAAPVTEKTGS